MIASSPGSKNQDDKEMVSNFSLVGVLVACSPSTYFRITGRLIPPHILYAICPPAIVAFAASPKRSDQVSLWTFVLVGNGLLYGTLAALLRLSVDDENKS